jgi:hypothetical protein
MYPQTDCGRGHVTLDCGCINERERARANEALSFFVIQDKSDDQPFQLWKG